MKISMQKISEIKPYALNAKQHPESQIKGLVESINRFGFTQPIVIDKNKTVIIGHGRLEAAKQCGLSMVPIIMRDDLTDQEVKALRLIDNRIAETGWDAELLHLDLKDFDFDFAPFHIDFDDIVVELEEFQSDVDPDDCPEVDEVEPRAKLGDVWILGDHRLMCGDSTKEADVVKLMDDKKADLVLTDPPYGVSYIGKTKDSLKIENDDLNENQLTELINKSFNNAYSISREGAYWMATVPAGPLHLNFASFWKDVGVLRQIMVWVKDSMVLGHSEYHYQHEPILFGWKPGGHRLNNPDRTRTTVWEFPRPKRSTEHPTMKPVELWSKMIDDCTKNDDLVYDPFLGSGTSIISAQKTNRKCYGMEIDPKYCDVIIKRWEDYTGLTSWLLKD